MQVQTQNLTVSFRSETAIRDVSVRIPSGEITAIVGPSGCGKTTLLQSINRITDLTPHCTTNGDILLDETNVLRGGMPLTQLRRTVGMVFQQPNPFPLSIAKNIQLPLREHGHRDRDQLQSRMQTSLEKVGLWEEVKHRLNDSAMQLSGGQKQRLCIARVLALQPSVLLLDEPCSALDPVASQTVEQLIQSLRGQYTVAIVTHNLAQARRLADHLIVFWYEQGAGVVAGQGPAEEVFQSHTNPNVRDYLDGQRG